MPCIASGPDFGLASSYTRKKLVTVLHENHKASSLIDNLTVAKRYSDDSCNTIPTSSDDESLSRSVKEVGLLLACHVVP